MIRIFSTIVVVVAISVVEFDAIENSTNSLLNALCPPFGYVGDRYEINVIGAEWPRIGGCATKQLRYRMDFWLGIIECVYGSCKYKAMDHYIFDCISAIYFKNVTSEHGEVSKLVYLTLYDRMSFRSGLSPYRCAIYKRNIFNGVMHLAISEKEDCDGLQERLLKTPIEDLTRTPIWKDGFLLLQFSRSLDTRRPKNSTMYITEPNTIAICYEKMGEGTELI